MEISDIAVKNLQTIPEIHVIHEDLDTYLIDVNHYNLIININYLNRRLIPYIKEGLTNNGIVIFETFLQTDDPGLACPSNKDFLLRPNELLHWFLSFRVLFYNEQKTHKSDGSQAYTASLVAKKYSF